MTVLGDTRIEGNEDVRLVLSGIRNAVFEGNAAALVGVGTIIDDDNGASGPAGVGGPALRVATRGNAGSSPTLSVVSTSIGEGNTGSVTTGVYLLLSQASNSDVTVSYNTVDGTALSSSDYYSDSGNFTIKAGSRSVYIPFTVLGDTNIEGDENFSVQFRNLSGATFAGGGATATANVLIRDNDGGGTAGTVTAGSSFSYARNSGLSDFDGNGQSDILWREAGGTFSTWQVTGNPGNQFAVNSTLVGGVGTDWKIQETFDFDGDSRSDILWRNQNSGEFTVWGGADHNFVANVFDRPGVGTNWQIAGVGDLNGDGKDDLVWREAGGAFSTWHSTGRDFNVNVDFDTSVTPDWQIVGLADFDGDGKDDLLWRNQQSGAFSTWTSNGTAFTPNTNFVTSVDTTWHIDGLADFNGDGRDDILWRHDGDGAFSVWQANAGGGFTPNTYFDTSVAPVWQVQTTGDFNDDGRADILWRNTASGDFSTWQSNGNAFDPNTAYVSGVGTNWQVQGHNFQFG